MKIGGGKKSAKMTDVFPCFTCFFLCSFFINVTKSQEACKMYEDDKNFKFHKWLYQIACKKVKNFKIQIFLLGIGEESEFFCSLFYPF